MHRCGFPALVPRERLVNPKVLVVDDEPATLFGFNRYLSKAGYDIRQASSLAQAREETAAQRFDAVLLDLMLPDGNGIDWIEGLRREFPDIAIIVITGAGDIPLAVDAMRRGADNFLSKPVSLPDLDVFLRKSLEVGTLRRRSLVQERLSKHARPSFGVSPAMKKVREFASAAAESDTTVLLTGETGTGKGIMARWIHENSTRRSGPFVEINCSSLRGELLASELFGHAKGAFTSAVQDKQGLIEVADGGTLFLDEIGDMDLSVQSQFLKVIEDKTFRRLGEVTSRQSNFRLIAATNRELIEETRKGTFRSDLFYRLNIFPLIIPPLRSRMEDLPGLIKEILAQLGAQTDEVSPEVMELLRQYPWPGNIRELRNILERALIMSGGRSVSREHIPISEPSLPTVSAQAPDDAPSLEKLEERYIMQVIQQSRGDLQEAAVILNMSRATLYRRLKKFRESVPE